MTKKVTIVFDDFILRKVYEKQSQLIKNSSKHVSFSSVVNDFLREGLK